MHESEHGQTAEEPIYDELVRRWRETGRCVPGRALPSGAYRIRIPSDREE
jgi:hypothetical protein